MGDCRELPTAVHDNQHLEELFREQRRHVSRAWCRSQLVPNPQHDAAYRESGGCERLNNFSMMLKTASVPKQTGTSHQGSELTMFHVTFSRSPSCTSDSGFGPHLCSPPQPCLNGRSLITTRIFQITAMSTSREQRN